MKTRLFVSLVALVALVVGPRRVDAQQTASEMTQRISEIEWVHPTGPGSLRVLEGALIVDAGQREIRLTTERGDSPVIIPFEHLVALHFEDTKYPGRGFLSRTKRYFTIFHTTAEGETVVEVLRMRADERARSAVDVIERATGQTVGWSLDTQSLLGIPIHVTVGTEVAVTTADGATVRGTIQRLTTSAIDIDTLDRNTRTFTAVDLRRIRLPYRAGRDARVGFVIGAVTGGLLGGLLSAGFCEDNPSGCGVDYIPAALLSAGVMGAAFAGISVIEGATSYRSNHAYDVYRSPIRLASFRVGVLSVTPQIGQNRAVLLWSLRR